MDEALLELLQCPACRGPLDWLFTSYRGNDVDAASTRCSGCGAQYAVRGALR